MSGIADLRSGFQLYNALIRPLRQMDRDAGNYLLQRYLRGAQDRFEFIEDTVLSLLDQVKPDKVRSELVQYLKDIVGFTNETRGITDRLDETALRRLIGVATAIWGERFTERGLTNAVRLLTGRTAFLTSWFGYRNLLGEAMIGEDQLVAGGDNWLIGGEDSRYDEYWSNIRIMDDGTLDELLLIDVLRLMRPNGERFEVFLEDFIDRFDAELDKWEVLTQTGAEPVIVDGAMDLDCAGTVVQPTVPLYDGTEDDYTIITKVKFSAVGQQFLVQWYIAAPNTYYLLAFSCGAIGIQRSVAGVVTFLDNTVLPDGSVSVVPDVWYKLRITNTRSIITGLKNIKVYIDANLILDQDDGSGSGAGPWTFAASGTPGELISLDNVEAWRNPGRFATIELSTVDERGGEVTMTDNFVQ